MDTQWQATEDFPAQDDHLQWTHAASWSEHGEPIPAAVRLYNFQRRGCNISWPGRWPVPRKTRNDTQMHLAQHRMPTNSHWSCSRYSTNLFHVTKCFIIIKPFSHSGQDEEGRPSTEVNAAIANEGHITANGGLHLRPQSLASSAKGLPVVSPMVQFHN
jgi:hypothetical protein